MKKNVIQCEKKTSFIEIYSLLSTVLIPCKFQSYIQIYIDIFEEFLEKKQEKKELFKLENLNNRLWFCIYEGILCKQHNGVTELLYRFVLNKVNTKIRELL